MYAYSKFGKTQNQYDVEDGSLDAATLERFTNKELLDLYTKRKNYGKMCKDSVSWMTVDRQLGAN